MILLNTKPLALSNLYCRLCCKKKNERTFECNSCLSLFIDESRGTFEIAVNKYIFDYFENQNCGGLTYPFKAMVSIYQAAYEIFSVCILVKFEKILMSLENQKWILVKHISRVFKSIREFWF